MKRKFSTALTMAASLAVILLFLPMAKADPLSVTITSPVTGHAGDTVAIFGTISNNSGQTVYLNQDIVSLPGPFSVDDTAFYTNAPLSLGNGESFTGKILDITLNNPALAGGYTGYFWVLGDTTGTGGADFLNGIGGTAFQVNVAPEPSSVILLASGLVGMVGTIRRRR